MILNEIKTTQEFENLVKERLSGKREKRIRMAEFVQNLFGSKPNLPQGSVKKIQERKIQIASLYGEDKFGQKIILGMPFVESCGDAQHKEIWRKAETYSNVFAPQYESREAFEVYFEEKAREFLKNSVHLLDAFAEKIFKGEDKARIAELYGSDFGKGIEILREMPFLEILVGENSVQTIRIRQDEERESDDSEPVKSEASPIASLTPNEKAKALLEHLNSGLLEKETEMRLAFLAAIAGESAFLIGLPGTAKSMVSRRLKEIFREPTYFEYLMHKFSTPDEIFGPVSINALGNDEYKRVVTNFLPSADVAFLDEIWKANSMILNTLLAILNERKFHNGNSVVKVPLKVLIAASNELPMRDSGLEALWDRFLFRIAVKRISNRDSFFEMIESTDDAEIALPEELKISQAEFEEWQEGIENVWIPEAVENVIWAVKCEMEIRNSSVTDETEKFDVSDRRWKKIVKMLRTSAFLNGRSEVDLMDCQLITYCIWSTENQRVQAAEIVEKCIGQNGLSAETAISELEKDKDAFNERVVSTFFMKVVNQETNRTELAADPSIFDKKDVYELTKAKYEREYEKIKADIEDEIAKLDATNSENEQAFSANLFAEQAMKAVIMKEAEKAKQELRKLSNRLEQVRRKYVR